MKESGSLDEISAKTSKGIAGAGVILNSHGHVLLVKHSYGPLNWELPGGAAERDESTQEGGKRNSAAVPASQIFLDILRHRHHP
ncbi:MAG TPA: NUDIX domain-containing protein [Chloroflexota bacterium]|nr:NUDIX domain-containing protein [Chloroflexota bacterium]